MDQKQMVLERGAERRNRLVPRTHVVGKNWEGYLSCGGSPLRSEGSQPFTGIPAQSTSVRKKSSHNSWLWKSVRIPSGWDEGLKGIVHRLNRWQIYSLSSRTGAATLKVPGTDIREETELSSFRKRAGRGSSFRQYVPLLSPPQTQPVCIGRCQIWVSTKLNPPY